MADNQYDPQYIQHVWYMSKQFDLCILIPPRKNGRTKGKLCGQVVHVSIESKFSVSGSTACVAKVQTSRSLAIVLKLALYKAGKSPPDSLKHSPDDDLVSLKAFGGDQDSTSRTVASHIHTIHVYTDQFRKALGKYLKENAPKDDYNDSSDDDDMNPSLGAPPSEQSQGSKELRDVDINDDDGEYDTTAMRFSPTSEHGSQNSGYDEDRRLNDTNVYHSADDEYGSESYVTPKANVARSKHVTRRGRSRSASSGSGHGLSSRSQKRSRSRVPNAKESRTHPTHTQSQKASRSRPRSKSVSGPRSGKKIRLANIEGGILVLIVLYI